VTVVAAKTVALRPDFRRFRGRERTNVDPRARTPDAVMHLITNDMVCNSWTTRDLRQLDRSAAFFLMEDSKVNGYHLYYNPPEQFP
jgi:hypothetical protein